MRNTDEISSSLQDLPLAAATRRLWVLIMCLMSLFVGLTAGLLCGLSLGQAAL